MNKRDFNFDESGVKIASDVAESATTEKNPVGGITRMMTSSGRESLIRTFRLFGLFPYMYPDLKQLEEGSKYLVRFSMGRPPMFSYLDTTNSGLAALHFDVLHHYGPLWKMVQLWYCLGLQSFSLTISIFDHMVYVTDAKVD